MENVDDPVVDAFRQGLSRIEQPLEPPTPRDSSALDALLVLAVIGLAVGGVFCIHLFDQVEHQSGWTTSLREIDGEQQTVVVNKTVVVMPDGRSYSNDDLRMWFHPTYVLLGFVSLCGIVALVLGLPRAIRFLASLSMLGAFVLFAVIALVILLLLPGIQAAH